MIDIYVNRLANLTSSIAMRIFKNLTNHDHMIPTDPAVKPTARKKTNSSKSLGKEFTIKFR